MCDHMAAQILHWALVNRNLVVLKSDRLNSRVDLWLMVKTFYRKQSKQKKRDPFGISTFLFCKYPKLQREVHNTRFTFRN